VLGWFYAIMSNQNFDLDQLRAQLPDFPGLKVNLGILKWATIGIIVAWAAITSTYSVPAESVGVILRFGKKQDTLVRPGLHLKLPFLMDRVFEVPVERQMKQEFGFGTPGATEVTQYSSDTRVQLEEKSMVSGDLNAALVDWVIQYRITDPEHYLFNVRNPGETLRDASESIMREVVGDRTIDEVITVGREEIQIVAQQKLQELLDRYQMGLTVQQIQLKEVNPPREVKPAFNEVNEAQQEQQTAVNVANGEYKKVIPQAEGEADQKISEAEGYATERVNEAEGDASRFNAVLAEYLKAEEVTRRRIYLETMSEVLPQLGNKIILDKDVQQVLPFLQLNPK
jgi:membrane protease subunit HflK